MSDYPTDDEHQDEAQDDELDVQHVEALTEPANIDEPTPEPKPPTPTKVAQAKPTWQPFHW